MPKKGEPLSDEHKEILAKAREKALAIRREKSKQKADIKLASQIEEREKHEKAQQIISKAVTKEEPITSEDIEESKHNSDNDVKNEIKLTKSKPKKTKPKKKIVYVEESSESEQEEVIVKRKKKGNNSKNDSKDDEVMSERDKLYLLAKKSLLGLNYS
ncbi:hypothetical protein CYMTET_18387 [Cymbomonas tetramitiformis]|uniref:Uncharacterized protein n=1 Tax=Cymbomonas tetramitiformis TaxID=36881 RepID=A0AAE0G8C8_9CHLO|nr:hypothetical protein CYMTET_18387 [Cymbomonas tetramitiformis]